MAIQTETRPTKPVALIKFHEIALKGQNQPFFKKKLLENLNIKLPHGLRAQLRHDRVLVELSDPKQFPSVIDAAEHTFGVKNLALTLAVEPAEKEITAAAHQLAMEVCDTSIQSFAVKATRADKSFPLTSDQLNTNVGEKIRQATGWTVNLSDPDITFFIEITTDAAYLYPQKFPGPGGLPTGTSGKLISLISGGIDSPVASWLAMRRGARVELVHCHSYPQTSPASIEKTRSLAKILAAYHGPIRLHLVPILDLQKNIRQTCHPAVILLVTRYLMLKLSEKIAEKETALGLVTGDSLGQVASQTLENIRAVSAEISLPIYRPLFGANKDEIISQAKKIGTFDTSILPHQDCCRLFVPKHPATKVSPSRLRKELGKLKNLDSMVKSVLENSSTEMVKMV